MLVDYFEAGDRLARVRKSSKWGCQTGNNMHSYFTRIPRHTTVHLKDAVFESLEFTRWDTRGDRLWDGRFHRREKVGIYLVSSSLLFPNAMVHSETFNCSRFPSYFMQSIRNSNPSPGPRSDGGSYGQVAVWLNCKAEAQGKDPAFPKQVKNQSLDFSGGTGLRIHLPMHRM